MTLESILSGLSTKEKLEAMNVLWRELVKTPADIESPKWHEDILTARLANPSAKLRLSIDAAVAEVKDELHARRTQG